MQRLTQFSIRSLLILTFAVAVACWWWRLPETTARQFVANPQAFAARESRAEADPWSGILGMPYFATVIARGKDFPLKSHPRTLWDCLAGRQSFSLGLVHFTAERGTIVRLFEMPIFHCPSSPPPVTPPIDPAATQADLTGTHKQP